MSSPSNVWHLLERAAREHGERIAIAGADATLDYRAFAADARALAGFFQARGLAPGDRVSILAGNGPEYLETYFAAAGAGLVLGPLNTRLAPRELVEVVRDAGSRWLVASTDLAPSVEALRADTALEGVLWIDGEADGVSWQDAHSEGAARFRPCPAGPEEPAQLYYTSGTTGRAKGVVLTHRNVCRHAENAVVELELTERDVWGHFAPLFHLADAWATFAITIVGGTHTSVQRFDAAAVIDVVGRFGVTLTNLVPTMIVRLLERLRDAPEELPSLRLVLSGGAPIAPSMVGRIQSAFGCEYAQTYGMTETSPYLTISRLAGELLEASEVEQLRRRARTGRPFRGVELEVVDAQHRAVRRDDREVGEIRVRGETVSPGYWRRPDETARAFADGWLYTGDLAVVDALGWVDIVDRKKDMIVTGGENVYSTEVENVLHELDSVLQAAAFGLPDDEWGERVCAAVVLVAGATTTRSELIDHCRARLATYKVPRELHIVDELPTTGSGKVHKPALRDRFGSVRAADSDDTRGEERDRMVRVQLAAEGIRDPRVLRAMRDVPRHRFVPERQRAGAYDDRPLPIGHGQTISQPYVVALMSEALALDGTERVLEVGTGSGYQAAVLAALVAEVYTIEIVDELARTASTALAGCPNVHVRAGDGYRGWPGAAPFDAIMLTAAPDHVPEPLVDRLAPGGRMILPVGGRDQALVLLVRTADGIERREILPVRFVPMTGEAERTR